MYSREALLKDDEEDEGKRAPFMPSTTTLLFYSLIILQWINNFQTSRRVLGVQVGCGF